MNIQLTLQQLVAYYDATRGAGHTLAMIHGAASTPGALVLAIGPLHGAHLQSTSALKHARVVPLPFVPAVSPTVAPLPLVLDNAALRFLCDQAAREIAALRAENAHLHELLLRRS